MFTYLHLLFIYKINYYYIIMLRGVYMRVVITAGGTGGHIYPALAIINEIKEQEPDSDILYIGTHNRMEKDIIPKYGIKYLPIEIYGFNKTKSGIKNDIKDLYLIPKAYKKCLNILKEFKPDIVIGVGGYVTYPVIKAANQLHIKTFIHEQNSIPGKANRALSKYASLVGVSIDGSEKYFKDTKCVLTGNPAGSNALKVPKISKTKYGLHEDKKGILIFNGSLGSKTVNDKMIDYLKSIGNEEYEVLYITGKSGYADFKKNNFPDNVFITDYVESLPGLMKDMDLIISRAGASSIAEITTLGIPCILIPSPYVANNHQYYNALAIKEHKAGEMIEEKDLNKDTLITTIHSILDNTDKYLEYKENLIKLSNPKSANTIYKEIKKLIS